MAKYRVEPAPRWQIILVPVAILPFIGVFGAAVLSAFGYHF